MKGTMRLLVSATVLLLPLEAIDGRELEARWIEGERAPLLAEFRRQQYRITNEETALVLASLLASEGDGEGALGLLPRVAGSSLAEAVRAQALASVGRTEEASQIYGSLAEDPQVGSFAFRKRIEILLDRRDFAAARAIAVERMARRPEESAPHHVATAVALVLGEAAFAEKILLRMPLGNAEPERAAWYAFASLVAEASGDLATARSQARTAACLRPEAPGYARRARSLEPPPKPASPLAATWDAPPPELEIFPNETQLRDRFATAVKARRSGDVARAWSLLTWMRSAHALTWTRRIWFEKAALLLAEGLVEPARIAWNRSEAAGGAGPEPVERRNLLETLGVAEAREEARKAEEKRWLLDEDVATQAIGLLRRLWAEAPVALDLSEPLKRFDLDAGSREAREERQDFRGEMERPMRRRLMARGNAVLTEEIRYDGEGRWTNVTSADPTGFLEEKRRAFPAGGVETEVRSNRSGRVMSIVRTALTNGKWKERAEKKVDGVLVEYELSDGQRTERHRPDLVRIESREIEEKGRARTETILVEGVPVEVRTTFFVDEERRKRTRVEVRRPDGVLLERTVFLPGRVLRTTADGVVLEDWRLD